MDKIQALATELNLPIAEFQADHLALRINDSELAKLAHKAWSEHGSTISEAMINGRPIVVILFDEPIQVKGWSIECLELPYPAEGKLYPVQDWEHVEFVIPSNAQSADDFFAELKQTYPGFEQAMEEGDFKLKLSTEGEGERLANPTVAIKTKGCALSFTPIR
ncbi:protein yecM [Vibrio sp. JCM 19236]|nr:protein yecM [Vibrio sp. JCM 19236]